MSTLQLITRSSLRTAIRAGRSTTASPYRTARQLLPTHAAFLSNSEAATPLSPLLPKLSFRGMASGPASPGVGPVLARAIADPTFYQNADTDAKVAVEKAIAEEKLEMCKPDFDVVCKGPLQALLLLLRHGTTTTFSGVVPPPEERTALWHVLYKDAEDAMIKIVYVYAHFEPEDDEEENMAALRGVLKGQFELVEKEGRLRGRKAFGIAQAGMRFLFFEYDGGGGGLSAVKRKK